MKKYPFLIVIICLMSELVVMPFGVFAASEIKISKVTPEVVR